MDLMMGMEWTSLKKHQVNPEKWKKEILRK
jgi:hypothetical protein